MRTRGDTNRTADGANGRETPSPGAWELGDQSTEPTTNRSEQPVRRTRRTAQVTSNPDRPAPQMFCPACDLPLVYRHTVVGGVKPLERWDYFECRTCGPFVYRDRTRQLRRAF
jgi:hypothetical protein